jgi:hypothetical protein
MGRPPLADGVTVSVNIHRTCANNRAQKNSFENNEL